MAGVPLSFRLAYTGSARDSQVAFAGATSISCRDNPVREKGGKVAVKPMPYELLEILRAAAESDEVACGPDDYVIPNRRPASVRRAERSDKVIWETVIKVAAASGCEATAHALRRAFAVEFLTSHPGALESLQALMNHSRIDTTRSTYERSIGSRRWRPSGISPGSLRVSVG